MGVVGGCVNFQNYKTHKNNVHYFEEDFPTDVCGFFRIIEDGKGGGSHVQSSLIIFVFRIWR